jgi:uncharacterized protein (DUF488 family)
MEIATVGFAGHSAESFFSRLKVAGIEQIIDVRLNNISQLAGFAKRDDLRFFLNELCGASYTHELQLAPTESILKDYRKGIISWEQYRDGFLTLMRDRRVEQQLSQELFSTRSALLCSEHTPEKCHRRLVVEYLELHWGPIEVLHL